VAPDPRLISAQDLLVAADHGQIYVSSSAQADDDDDSDEYADEPTALAALYDAWDSDRFVGVRTGFIDVLTPGQYNSSTPMRLEVWSAEPADDRDGWDHEVDADFDIPDGRIFFEASGGSRATTLAEIPPGSYRVRVSGRGFTETGLAGANGDDSYRLRLWPRGDLAPAVLRKRWPGWDRPGMKPDEPVKDTLGRTRPPTARPPVVASYEAASTSVTQDPGLVVVVALDAAGRILLVPGHLPGTPLSELPARQVDQPGEDPLTAAQQLLTEAGLRADSWSSLRDLPALPGATSTASRIYLARDLHPAEQPNWITLDQAVDDVFGRVIHDAVAAVAITAAAQARDTGWAGLRPAAGE